MNLAMPVMFSVSLNLIVDLKKIQVVLEPPPPSQYSDRAWDGVGSIRLYALPPGACSAQASRKVNALSAAVRQCERRDMLHVCRAARRR